MSSVWNLRFTRTDRNTKILVNKCDMCDYPIKEAPDDLEAKIRTLEEINDSYESEYDKDEPRLILCDYCQKEFLITGYKIN
jgi:hypothetical protein